MNPYVMLAISTTTASIFNLATHKFGNKSLRGLGDVVLFNAAASVVWVVELLVIGGGFTLPSPVSVVCGLLYGVASSAFFIAKNKAMTTGPISISTLTGNCAMLIPTIVGAIVWNERILLSQILGVAVMVAALFLCVNIRVDREMTLKWKIWCGAFFFTGGFLSLVFKVHQTSDGASEYNDMMVIAAVTMVVLMGGASFAVSRAEGKGLPRLGREALLFAPISGLLSCTYQRINIPLVGELPSAVFFPILNGGVIMLVTLGGWLIFRERLTRGQLCGMALGTLAIMLLGKIISF